MASQLSPRQREILDLVAEGRTSKEIAVTLGISESTVNWHLANAFERLGASSRAEAVALAIRSNGATPRPLRPERVSPTPAAVAWPRLVAIAIAIAIAGALLGGATVAKFHLGQEPAATASPADRSDGSAPSTPASGEATPSLGGAEPTADPTAAPLPQPSTGASLPVLSAPPVPAVPVTLPPAVLPSLPVTPPPLPSPSLPLPPLPIPTPTLPIP